jgi:protoporphyrinogen oxidase
LSKISEKLRTIDRRTFIKSLGILGGLGLSAAWWPPESLATQKPIGKAAVIGAGVAGLAAARSLAQAGWQVDVFEKGSHPGGFCSTLTIEGFRFDLGPHVFHPSIRQLVPFKSNDLDAATFSESFLLNGDLLNFPKDLLTHGYSLDIIYTLARNTMNPQRLKSSDMEALAKASYGEKASSEIFKPLIEKWCGTPLRRLDRRYFASRMHSRLQMDSVMGYLRSAYADMEKAISRRWGAHSGNSPSKIRDGIPDAPGYSGRIGAQIVPDRLAQSTGSLQIHCNRSVKAIGVSKGRIEWLDAGGSQIRPDFVISTAPLNRFASMIEGSDTLKPLAGLRYLHVVFIFARIKRNRLLKTEWTWIPEPDIPFYRVSEMKVLNKDHAPKDCTGLCMEVSIVEGDPRFQMPDQHWKDKALNFLDKVFSVRNKDIIGLDVEKRKYAYPDFTVDNTKIISNCLTKPYVAGDTQHHFRTGIENLAVAGRTGAFIYLLTPWAILSGQRAARQAIAYAAGRASKEAGGI